MDDIHDFFLNKIIYHQYELNSKYMLIAHPNKFVMMISLKKKQKKRYMHFTRWQFQDCLAFYKFYV